MQGQCRIQKRNWICESGYIPASSSRPKKCKEDLKRYAFTLGGVQQLRRKEKRGGASKSPGLSTQARGWSLECPSEPKFEKKRKKNVAISESISYNCALGKQTTWHQFHTHLLYTSHLEK